MLAAFSEVRVPDPKPLSPRAPAFTEWRPQPNRGCAAQVPPSGMRSLLQLAVRRDG